MQVQVEVGDKYGLYAALLNLAAVLNIGLDLGLNNYNNRKLAINNNRFSEYFRNISIARIGLALAYTVVLFLVGVVLGYDSESLKLLLLLGFSQILLSSLLYIRSNFTAFGKYKLDSVFSVLDRLLMIGGVYYLFAHQGEGMVNITNFIYVQLVGYWISFLMALIALFIIAQPVWPRYNKRFTKVLLKKSAPYALIVILMAAYNYSDSIMIERILPDGEAQNAIYAQSFRILMALNNYAYLFAVLLLPMFSKMIANKKSVQELIATSSSLLIYGVSVIAILFVFYGHDVIAVCYGEFPEGAGFMQRLSLIDSIQNATQVSESTRVFKLLILGIIPMSINYCFGTLITASGNMKVLNKIASVSLLLNVVLNFILIPEFGAYGAAMASLITQTASGVGQVIFAVKLFNILVNIKGILRFVFGLMIIGGALVYLDELEVITRWFTILALCILGLLASVNLKGVLKMAKGLNS